VLRIQNIMSLRIFLKAHFFYFLRAALEIKDADLSNSALLRKLAMK